MGRRQRQGVELIELIEPDDQGWDAIAPAANRSAAGSRRSMPASGPTTGPGRGKRLLVAAGLVSSFGLGVVVQRIASGDGTDVASLPSTTAAPSSTRAPSTTTEPPIIFVNTAEATTRRLDPLLVDMPGMIAVSAHVTDRPANDSSSSRAVVVFRNPSTGETLRLREAPQSTPRAVSRVDLGEGLVGYESRIGDVTTVMLEGSDPVRAVVGTASRDTLHRVLVVAEQGGNVEDAINSFGFVVRHVTYTGGLWESADEATVTYAPINDPRSTPSNDRPSLTLSQLRQTGIPEPWALVLPQRFDVRGTTAYGGYLDSQAVLGVQLADQVVVLRSSGFSLEQLAAAAATLRPASDAEWNEIQSGSRPRDQVARGQEVLTSIDSGVLLGGTPWATEVLRDFAGLDSWGVQAGLATTFSYLDINRVERPLLVSTVVLGATAVLAVAPRDGVYQLRVMFGDGVQLDLPLRAITDDSIVDSDWHARSYMWSELGPWSAAVVDDTGVVVATLDSTQ